MKYIDSYIISVSYEEREKRVLLTSVSSKSVCNHELDGILEFIRIPWNLIYFETNFSEKRKIIVIKDEFYVFRIGQ